MLVAGLDPRSRVTLAKAKSNPSAARISIPYLYDDGMGDLTFLLGVLTNIGCSDLLLGILIFESGYHQLRECMKKIFQRLPLGRGMDVLSNGYAFWINQCTNGFHGLEEPGGSRGSFKVGVGAAEEGKVVCLVFQKWAKEQEEAFQTLKGNLRNAPILSLPGGSKEFVGYCDASNQGLGCVLMQRGKVENATAEMLRGLDQLMERKEGGGADKTYYDLRDMYGGHVWRRILLPMFPRSSSGYDTNWVIVDRLTKSACVDHLRSWWKIYFEALVDIAEGIENTAKTCVRLIILKRIDKAKVGESGLIRPSWYKRQPTRVEIGDKVMLKVSSWKDLMHLEKKEMLAPIYVGPFEIIKGI
ncbi:putative reverse transcriptase domain-containing protein [Tanacetum coccineum]